MCKDANATVLVSDDFLRTLREDRGSIPAGIRGKHAPPPLSAVRSAPQPATPGYSLSKV